MRATGPLRRIVGTPTGAVALVVVALIGLLALLAPVVWGDAAEREDFLHVAEGPSAAHWFGTDALGRDILARTLVATRLSIGLAVGALVVATLLGVPIGLLVGVARGRTRRAGAAVIDTWIGFPSILLALVLVTIIGRGATSAVIVIGIAFAPFLARVTSTLATSVTTRDYVAAARLLGLPRRRVLGRYVLANMSDSLVVTILGAFGDVLVAIAALSFLGLGVQPPAIDWGRLLTEGVEDFYLAPAAALGPAIFIACTGVAIAWLGDALARALNPQLSHGRRRARTRP